MYEETATEHEKETGSKTEKGSCMEEDNAIDKGMDK